MFDGAGHCRWRDQCAVGRESGTHTADPGKKSRCSSASRRRCIEGNDCAQSNAEAYFGSLNARLTRGDPFCLGGGEP